MAILVPVNRNRGILTSLLTAYNLRTGEDYHIPAHARTERFKKSFSLSSVKLWNTLVPFDILTH